MEKLLVAIVLLIAPGGMARGEFGGMQIGADVQVECARSGRCDLQLRARVFDRNEVWRVCVTREWRACRA
jgi:hypothetical protein